MYVVLIINLLIPNYSFAESNDAFTLVKMKSISGGAFYSASVDINGNVWTWGDNKFGQLGDGTYYSRSIPSKVEGLSGFKSVSCGANHVLALKEDGTVWSWGLNMLRQLGCSNDSFSQNTPGEVTGLSGVKAVAGGANHSVALKKDGTVWAWGGNSEGQLGRETDVPYSEIPEAIEGMVDIIEIAAFNNYTVALRNDGTVWICGQVSGKFIMTAVQVEELEHIKSIATLFNGIVALKEDGTVVLCSGGYIKYLNGLNDVDSVSCSQYQITALKKDGSLWISGEMYPSSALLLGNYELDKYDNPTNISNITDVNVMASGYNHILFLKKDGTVWGMGNNQYGQLGNGVAISRTMPVKVKGLSNVRNIDANGYYHSMALINDGSVRVWGNEVKFHLDGEFSSIPKVVHGINNVVSITGNYTNYAVLKEDGTVWNWGPNVNEPTEVKKLDGVTDISGGNNVSFQFTARKSDGTVWRFSKSSYMVDGLTNIIAISEGRDQTLALKEDGTVWSLNEGNQNGKKPIKVPELSDVTAISTGDNMSLALKNDGTVWTWSIYGNANLQSLQPVKIEGLSDIIAVSGADTALRSDGTVWKWGKNDYGQIGNGTMEDIEMPVKVIGLEGIVKISSNEWHSLALDKNGEVWAWGRNNEGQLGDGTSLYENRPVQCMSYSNPRGDGLTDIIKVTVNNEPLLFDVLPINVNNRILVPMRLIFESLGAQIEWDEKTLIVTAKKDGKTMKIRVGSTEAFINGQKVVMDTPANLYGGRMLVPVRFISESLGARVDWDSYSRTVIINSN